MKKFSDGWGEFLSPEIGILEGGVQGEQGVCQGILFKTDEKFSSKI